MPLGFRIDQGATPLVEDRLSGLDGAPGLPDHELDGGLDLGFGLLFVRGGKENIISRGCVHESQLVLTCDACKSISRPVLVKLILVGLQDLWTAGLLMRCRFPEDGGQLLPRIVMNIEV